jgi:hypothetical protein
MQIYNLIISHLVERLLGPLNAAPLQLLPKFTVHLATLLLFDLLPARASLHES